MRLSAVVLTGVVVPALLATPVLTAPAAAPRPVDPKLHTLALPAPAVPAVRAPALRTAERVAELAPTSTRHYSTVGVTWRRTAKEAKASVEVRTRAVDGGWRGWQQLVGQHDEGPDAGSRDVDAGTRNGTAPLYAGPSNGVQVRVRTADALPDLRVDMIDAGSAPVATGRRAPAATAYAAAPGPAVVSRQQWGANEGIKTCFSGYTGAPKVGYVHHTAGNNTYRPEESAAVIRGIYAYHVQSNGWCDIGYQFLVDRYGVVFEGRGGGLDRNPLGAHAAGFNTNTVGVGLMGSFQPVSPPPVMISALESVLAWKLGLGYADPFGTADLVAGSGSKYRAGSTVSLSVVSGHRDTSDTTCPGALTYAQLPQIRERVRALMGAGLVGPGASASSVPVGGSPVQVRAGLLQPADWQLQVVSTATGQLVRTLTGRGESGIDTAWDLRDAQGAVAPAGTYTLALSAPDGAEPFVPWTGTLRVGTAVPLPPPVASATPTSPTASTSLAPSSPAPTSPDPTTGSGYLPVPPARILDTRIGTGAARAPLGAGGSLRLQVLGVAGLPRGAVTAVALNLTGTGATARTHLTVYPSGSDRPSTSVLNLGPGQTTASAVVAGVGTDGGVRIYNQAGSTQVVADIVGYWAPGTGGRYHPVPPARLLDTRTGGGRLGDGETRSLPVAGRAGVPSDGATGAILNVTAVTSTKAGYLTVSGGGARPRTSNVNFPANKVVPNRVITGFSGAGAVELYNTTGSTHVLADLVGWFAPPSVPGGSGFTVVAPYRALDTRAGTGAARGPLGAGQSLTMQATGGAVPGGAVAVVVTLTATGATAGTHVTAWPSGSARPGTSDLNLLAGETVPNLAVVPLGPNGAMQLYNAGGQAHLLADVVGYYR